MCNDKKILENPVYSLYLEGSPYELKTKRKIKILISNSDIIFCELLKQYAEEHYPNISMILIEDNGMELLEKIETENPEFIIIGCQLKEVSGEEAIKRLQNSDKKPVIFVMSSFFIDSEYIDYIYTLGADYCIKKFTPFTKIFEQIGKYL